MDHLAVHLLIQVACSRHASAKMYQMFSQMHKVVTKSGFALLALTGILALTTSCATNSESASAPTFYEAEAANLVLRYSSDHAIFRIKPDGREGNFYHVYSRKEVCDTEAKRGGQRNLAVVLIGRQFTPELDRQLKQSWVDTLTKLNYRRVVVLRCGDNDQVNGLRVLEDRQNAQVVSAPVPGALASMFPSQQAAR